MASDHGEDSVRENAEEKEGVDMADEKTCSKCIHKAVCKTAESCDGYVPGCKHFKEQKKGRWTRVEVDLGCGIKTHRNACSECGFLKNTLTGNYCPKCGADMRGEEDA